MAVEIYFNDLTEDAQKLVLQEVGISSPEDGNFELAPLFVYEVDDEVRRENLNELKSDNNGD